MAVLVKQRGGRLLVCACADQSRRLFFALWLCSLVSVLFLPCGSDCRVLAVVRPGVINFGTSLRCLFVLVRDLDLCIVCVYYFRLGACFFFRLQDWWVDQHGDYTWHVPPKLWQKAAKYTDCESLAGPVGVEDPLCHFVSCLLYFVRWWSVECF